MARYELHTCAALELLARFEADTVDAVVTDPPYALRMGEVAANAKRWDYDLPDPATWIEALRVLKPGGHAIVFSSSRTFHRLWCAVEDAGFEIRDTGLWLYGQGYPKGTNVGKAIDKALGVERPVIGYASYTAPDTKQSRRGFSAISRPEGYDRITPEITGPGSEAAAAWEGWNTTLKPAFEPFLIARKPLDGGIVENVLTWGVGGLNIDACRVAGVPWKAHRATGIATGKFFSKGDTPEIDKAPHAGGRWPANVLHDGSLEVLAGFPEAGGGYGVRGTSPTWGPASGDGGSRERVGFGDEGSAARFFYTAKASKWDREVGLEGRNGHPTVKPTDLMRWCCRLVTPAGGVVVDPFMGSGSTGVAAMLEGFRFVGGDLDAEFVTLAQARIKEALAQSFEARPRTRQRSKGAPIGKAARSAPAADRRTPRSGKGAAHADHA